MKISNFKLKIIFAVFLLMFGIVGLANADETGSGSAEMTKVAKIDYQLPYPGLLPDHPLYFLKAARERLSAFFIAKPVRKAEFDLLLADKRVAASLSLVQKGKIDMSESTFSKAENYFEDGLNREEDAKTQGVHITELAGKFVTANRKHQEVLQTIISKINVKNKKKFVKEQSRLIMLGKRARELSK